MPDVENDGKREDHQEGRQAHKTEFVHHLNDKMVYSTRQNIKVYCGWIIYRIITYAIHTCTNFLNGHWSYMYIQTSGEKRKT